MAEGTTDSMDFDRGLGNFGSNGVDEGRFREAVLEAITSAKKIFCLGSGHPGHLVVPWCTLTSYLLIFL